MNYNQIFLDSLEKVKEENRYREFQEISRIAGQFPVAYDCTSQKNITIWCINDYLGMGQHEKVINSVVNTTKQMGAGAGGTRNLSGNNHPVAELERTIAKLHKKEKSLVFTSGYVANDTTISTLVKIMPNCEIFSDENNHASIISGIKKSGAKKHIFRHNDLLHLEELLSQANKSTPKLIIFESVYSMNGAIANIPAIVALAKKYDALTYVDEVHAVGIYGKTGAGIAEQQNIMQEIDIIQGTLGKSYGVIGGYIAANKSIIEAVRLNGPGFIFTTALPPGVAAGANASILHLMESQIERNNHKHIVKFLKNLLTNYEIDFIKNNSHIIAIVIGCPTKAKQASKMLLERHGIYVQHINYPTVKKGTERLRITPTSLHTEQMAIKFVKALKDVLEELDFASHSVPENAHILLDKNTFTEETQKIPS